MTQPYPQQYPPPYPQQAPAYPAQQPVYPPQPQYQQAPPPAPGYGYPPQPPVPQQPLVSGTLDDFYNQPSAGGGAALKFDQLGTRYVGIVTRPIGSGDIQQQTDVHQRPQFFKDGRPKFVMKVPLQMQPSQQYADGLAQWYVKGQARDELVRAMAEAGAPEGPPEHGAVIDVTFVNERPAGVGMNPAKQFQVRYTRPNTAPQAAPAPVAAPVQQPPAQPAPPANYAPAPVQQPAPQQQYQQPAAPAPQQYAPAPVQQAAPQQAPAQAPAPQPAPQQAAQAPQAPADLTPDQQALLARISGQAPAQ